MHFNDVYVKSACQPRDLLVDIYQEFPEHTETIFIPSCVVLRRCGGCCNDEALECVPTQSRNATLQVRPHGVCPAGQLREAGGGGGSAAALREAWPLICRLFLF